MNRTIASLLFVLLIQAGIVAVVYWSGEDSSHQAVAQALVPFDIDSIDEVQIVDQYDNETVLQKAGDHWILPTLASLPANPDMVQKLVQGISAQNIWPIAHSTVARQRFQVADYHFQRSLTLSRAGKQLGTIYLGTSPGFRKVHARNSDQQAIYSISFNTFDAPAVRGTWLEPKLLQIRAPVSITADSYSLNREGGNWLAATGRAPDERELQALLTALRTLQIDGVASNDRQRDLSEAEADLILQVRGLAGETTLELFTLEQEHFILSSEYELFFGLSAYDFDRLTSIDFRLISGEAAPGTEPDSSAAADDVPVLERSG